MSVSKITSLSISSISKIYGIELSNISSIYGQVISIASTWLDGWDYRKSITLSRASGAVTNYQMKLLVGESSGATGEDVDCGGKCLSSFNDIRFTTSDKTTLLDYWIESISGTTPNQLATVWIEFDSIGTSDTTFYMYYGKSDAAAASNGANTFILFDDFERGNDGDDVGGDWTASGTCQISTSSFFGGTRSCKISPRLSYMTQVLAASQDISVRMATNGTLGINCDPFGYGNGTNRTGVYFFANGDIETYNGAAHVDTGANWTSGSWKIAECNNHDFTNGTFDIWYDGVKIATGAGMYSHATLENTFRVRGDSAVDKYLYIDNFIVRNWRPTEPAWGAWGTEETT